MSELACFNNQLINIINIVLIILVITILLCLSYNINLLISTLTENAIIKPINKKNRKYVFLNRLLPSILVLFNFSLIFKVFFNILGFNFYLIPIITMLSAILVLVITNELKEKNTTKLAIIVNSFTAGLVCLIICWIVKTDLIATVLSNNESIKQWLEWGLFAFLSFMFANGGVSINSFTWETEIYATRAGTDLEDSLFVSSSDDTTGQSPSGSSDRSNNGSVSESLVDPNEKTNSFLMAALNDIEARNKEIEAVTNEIKTTELVTNKMSLADKYLMELIKTSNITEQTNIDLDYAKIFSSGKFPYTGEELKAHFEQYVIEAMQGKHNNNQGILFACPAKDNNSPIQILIKQTSYLKEGFYSRIQVYEFSRQIYWQRQAYYAKLVEQSKILTQLNERQNTIVEFVNMNTSTATPLSKNVKTITEQIKLKRKFED